MLEDESCGAGVEESTGGMALWTGSGGSNGQRGGGCVEWEKVLRGANHRLRNWVMRRRAGLGIMRKISRMLWPSKGHGSEQYSGANQREKRRLGEG